MKLVVGLGNIGSQYEKTRHNAGFLVVDQLAKFYDVNFLNQASFKTLIADGVSPDGNQFILAKPTTMMNDSGFAVKKIIDYFDIDIKDLIVIVDDLDRSVGKLRIKKTGSSGGHNGLKSIVSQTGAEEYLRIRVGIGRPAFEHDSVINHVLGEFSKTEWQELLPAIDNARDAAIDLIDGQALNFVTNKYNN